MPNQIFEQPVGENRNGEIPEAERDRLIEEAERRLQVLMARALEKLNSDFEAGLISEDVREKRYNLLLQVNEEIASADEKSGNVNETLARLEEIRNRFELLLNIKRENEAKQVLSYDKTGGKNAKRKRGVGLFGRRTRSGDRDYKKSPMPPATSTL